MIVRFVSQVWEKILVICLFDRKEEIFFVKVHKKRDQGSWQIIKRI